MYLETQPWEVDDFSGGQTDFYVGAPANRYQQANNLVIVKHGNVGKLKSRFGSEIWDDTNYQIPAGSQRVGAIKIFDDTALFSSANKFYYVSSGAWATLVGPSSNNVFPSTITTSNYVSMATWNNHLFVVNDGFSKPQKIYFDSGAVLRVRTAGMPALASSPSVVSSGGSGNNYIYAFTYHYTYTVGTRTFTDEGAVTQVSLANAGAPNANTVNITSIPVIANGTTDNYDTASSDLKVRIYRTINAGTQFYYVGSVANGTTTYNDTASDATIQNNALLYTEGGVVENDTPPLCKFIHVVGDKGYYGHTKSGTEIFKSRVFQSIPSDIDSVPATFFTDVDDELAGLSSAKGTPLAICSNSVYRIDGEFDELGRGGMFSQKISDTATCISGQSVVQTLEGVFWAGLDGLYYSDGYQVIRVNSGWRDSYQDFTETASFQPKIQGKYDIKNRRIWWSVQDAGTDVNKSIVLDLNWGISDDMPCTIMENGDSYAPTAMEFDGATMLRGDRRGYVFIHRESLFVDPEVDELLTPDDWIDKTIVYDYRSAAFNFGSSFMRYWIPRINVRCENETNLSLQIVSNNDINRKTSNLKPIRYRGNTTWGDEDVVWSDPDLPWNQEGLIEAWRRFPAKNLRCSYKQIYLTNATVVIISSDVLGTATVSFSAKTAVLTDTSLAWPSASIDYSIAFANDDYTIEFPITALVSGTDTITFNDPLGNSPPNGTYEWVIRGVPKGEILNLQGYTIHYAPLGKTQAAFRSSQTGEIG